MSAVLTPYAIPPIGAYWSGEGGLFCGIFQSHGKPRALILAEPYPASRRRWHEGMDWAAGLVIDGHRDFTLPDRHESWLLCATMREHFHIDLYWTRTRYSNDDTYCHDFLSGASLEYSNIDEARVRACRSFVIDPHRLAPEKPSLQAGDAR